MSTKRYKPEDLLDFGCKVMERLGFPAEQALSACTVLLEGDLRGDFAHGLAGNIGLSDFIDKAGDLDLLGFERLSKNQFTLEESRYPTIIPVDAQGCLGHHVALSVLPLVIERAKRFGFAKAYIKNSTHFGDCGIYSEMIGQAGLVGRVTCTAPAWSKPFVELQDRENLFSPANRNRYQGVKKRLGTNPVAWTIPYDQGLITMDMAATQRAVSPALAVAKHNAAVAGVFQEGGEFFIKLKGQRLPLADVHLDIAASQTREEALTKLGLPESADLMAAERGLFMGPNEEEIVYPLALDTLLKKECHIAPLGGAFFGYKGYGLNLLIEMDNVLGGGAPELIRQLSPAGLSTTNERVSQTIEAQAIDGVYPAQEALARLGRAVKTTLACCNHLGYLPGQKEQEHKKDCLAHGVPLSPDLVAGLKRVADHPRVGLPFNLKPIA